MKILFSCIVFICFTAFAYAQDTKNIDSAVTNSHVYTVETTDIYAYANCSINSSRKERLLMADITQATDTLCSIRDERASFPPPIAKHELCDGDHSG